MTTAKGMTEKRFKSLDYVALGDECDIMDVEGEFVMQAVKSGPILAEMVLRYNSHDALVSALETMLNVECPPHFCARTIKGLDYDYHFNKLRATLNAAKKGASNA